MKTILASILLVALCSGIVSAQRTSDEAPNFALKDIYGKTVYLSDYRGKIVLVYFYLVNPHK